MNQRQQLKLTVWTVQGHVHSKLPETPSLTPRPQPQPISLLSSQGKSGNFLLGCSFSRAAKERWLFAFDSRTSCQVWLRDQKRIFLPKGDKKIMPPPSPKQRRRPESGVEFSSWRVGGTSVCDLSSRHSPAAGSVRSTRPTPLHGSASRSVLPTQTRPRGWDAGGPTASWGATCCARSARRAGAERFPLGW